MSKEYLLILALGHILGDFYFQSDEMAKKKEEKPLWLFLHCAVYILVMVLFTLCFFPEHYAAAGAFIAGGIHFIVDLLKYLYIKSVKKEKKETELTGRNVFFIDQILHAITLIGTSICIASFSWQPVYGGALYGLFKVLGTDEYRVVLWASVLLAVHKPANIAISLLMKRYRVEDKDISDDKNAGRFIGSVERILMVILLAQGQYAAIGLVLTAKSIARYDRISREPAFAEYYLLGTLLSTLIAITASFPLR